MPLRTVVDLRRNSAASAPPPGPYAQCPFRWPSVVASGRLCRRSKLSGGEAAVAHCRSPVVAIRHLDDVDYDHFVGGQGCRAFLDDALPEARDLVGMGSVAQAGGDIGSVGLGDCHLALAEQPSRRGVAYHLSHHALAQLSVGENGTAMCGEPGLARRRRIVDGARRWACRRTSRSEGYSASECTSEQDCAGGASDEQVTFHKPDCGWSS